MTDLSYLKDRHKQYMAGLAQDQHGTARSDLGLAVKEVERLYELHLERTKLTMKMITERDEARVALEQWKTQYQDSHSEVGILNDEARELRERIEKLEGWYKLDEKGDRVTNWQDVEHICHGELHPIGTHERIAKLEAAMQEFVDRCAKGEVLSKYTRAKFEQLLAGDSDYSGVWPRSTGGLVMEDSTPLMDVILEDLKENDVDPAEVFGTAGDTIASIRLPSDIPPGAKIDFDFKDFRWQIRVDGGEWQNFSEFVMGASSDD